MEREVEHTLEQCMTTRQLVDHLLSLDPGADEKGGDMRVLFTCNYGDRRNTEQALPVAECDEFCTSILTGTAYSQSGIARSEDDEQTEPADDDEPVILLCS